jgi:alcohol dehydrogenase (cytochrome c)
MGVPLAFAAVVLGGSDEGNFYALDALTGAPMAANAVSFTIDGHQHVAMAAGHGVFVFGL